MVKPTILLDVDGVVNVCNIRIWHKVFVQITHMMPGGAPLNHKLHTSPFTLPFLKWAWQYFRVYWLTSWLEGAHAISDWAGLKRVPVLGRREWANPKRYRKTKIDDWKLLAVQHKFRRKPAAPVFWLEDGIGKEAHAWLAGQPWIRYIEIAPEIGVTAAHARLMATIAKIPVPRIA